MRDPYDISVAFDDVLGATRPRSTKTVRSVMRRVLSKRPAPVPMKVRPVDHDPTAESFAAGYEIIGDDDVVGATERALRFPIYEKLRHFFQARQPAPKYVRLDTPASYRDFREARRLPYLATLESSPLLDGDFLSVAALLEVGGKAVPLGRNLDGKVEAWQDDDELLCTIRFCDRSGNLCMLTTGAPVDKYLDEIVWVMGDEVDEIAPSIPYLAQVVGVRELLPELCRAVPNLSTGGNPSTMIGLMVSGTSTSTAAAMALLQECQQGNCAAVAEAEALYDSGEAPLLTEAKNLLVRGQRHKRRRIA